MTNRPIGGIGRELEETLARLHQLCAEAPGPGDERRAAWEARYRELREEAGRLRWALIVQREALGILENEDVYRSFPLPSSCPPAPK